MKIIARWEFFNEAPRHCDVCARRIIPYIPTCTHCGAPTPSAAREVAYDALDLDKPEGATRVVHLSDLHVGQHMPEERVRPMAVFRIWLEALGACAPDILIVSGDLVERPGDAYGMGRVHALLNDFGTAWMVVPGNHDIKRPGYHDAFNDIYGDYPRVETHHGIDFILFDSMAGLPLDERDVAERVYGDYVCYTEGRVGERQYAIAHDMLAGKPQRPRAIVLHHHVMRQHADLMPNVPRQVGLTEDIFGTMKALMDADHLFEWASDHGVHTVYHGHKHLFQQPGLRAHNLLILNAGSSTLRDGDQLARIVDYLPDRRIVSNVRLPM